MCQAAGEAADPALLMDCELHGAFFSSGDGDADRRFSRGIPGHFAAVEYSFRSSAASRRQESSPARTLEEVPEPRVSPAELADDPEQRLACLRRCLSELSPETRNLILHYYQGDKGDKIKNRKGLTEFLGIPPSTLRMRALRVRERLQLCAESCMQRAAGSSM